MVYYHIEKFWNDEFKSLPYTNEVFNDEQQIKIWKDMGYADKFTGDMCDMRQPQPSWNNRFIEYYKSCGWHDIGTSYYRMGTGTILPTHKDLYLRYIDIFNLAGQEYSIQRAIVFLEDWRPGHYAEYQDKAFTHWQAGDVVEWNYDEPHMAANLGPYDRYTLQITGHL